MVVCYETWYAWINNIGYIISAFAMLYFAAGYSRYKNFVEQHLKKSQEFIEWNNKRKEMNKW